MELQIDSLQALQAARCIADYAIEEGVKDAEIRCRPTYDHMGAVLADSVLQAGLNYASVVKPRVQSILESFPHARTVDVLVEVVRHEGSGNFLQWRHQEKTDRFDALISFLVDVEIRSTADFGEALNDDQFRHDIRQLRGVGPKTVDYMACLVGVDCIAVDRHIKGFAQNAGFMQDNYELLKDIFSFAADLLDMRRREFDAWVWQYQVNKSNPQLAFAF